MEQLLEEVERLAILEHAVGNALAIRYAVLSEDVLAEPLDESLLHVRIGGKEMVDDLIARDGRRAMAAKGRESCRLAGADPAGDRDRERARQALVGLLGAGLDGLLLR